MQRTTDTTIAARLDGQRFWLTLQDVEGSLIGIELTYHEAESNPRASLLHMAARTATLALQQGVKPEDLIELWLGTSFGPRGRVQDAERGVSYFARSVLDWAAREIGAHYCDRPELVGQVREE